MFNVAMTPMRIKLREETADIHAELDSAFSKLDLTDRRDLIVFLCAHRRAMLTLRPSLKKPQHIQAMDTRLRAIEADLLVLGVSPEQESAAEVCTHPLGVAYVIAGSHLGQNILKKRWEKSSDPHVLKAGDYFNLSGAKQAWQEILSDLSEIDADGVESTEIVESAQTAFRVFEMTLKTHSSIWPNPCSRLRRTL